MGWEDLTPSTCWLIPVAANFLSSSSLVLWSLTIKWKKNPLKLNQGSSPDLQSIAWFHTLLLQNLHCQSEHFSSSTFSSDFQGNLLLPHYYLPWLRKIFTPLVFSLRQFHQSGEEFCALNLSGFSLSLPSFLTKNTCSVEAVQVRSMILPYLSSY